MTSNRPKPRDVPGTAGTRTTSTGRTIPFPNLECERCGDKFAGASEYEVHAQVLGGERGACLTHEQRRAIRTGDGTPYPMTETGGVWSFPPNAPEAQAVLEELVDDAQAGMALAGAVDEAMRPALPLWVRTAMRLPRWVRVIVLLPSWLRWRRQKKAATV